MSEDRPRIVIAGAGSGVGKTTVTLGLMAAFGKRGLEVQGFKAGPDYIDPGYHTAVTGRPSRNLDTWMLAPDTMREIFLRGSRGADISIIEGVMGLYDGKGPLSDRGSTAEIAIMLQSPVILVINIDSMARSAAAVVKGYQLLNPAVPIAGVIANRGGSEGHFRLVQAAIEQECGIPVLGWIARDPSISIPERHLGLIPAIERGETNSLFARLAVLIEKGIDLDRLQSLASKAPRLEMPEKQLFANYVPAKEVTIAVARDAAFNFYYPENLELLAHGGARLQFFSPLRGEHVPEEADGLYIGGGFPEEFVRELSGNSGVKDSFRRKIGEGMPTCAECGGYMYLTEVIIDREGNTRPMAGVIPAVVRMKDGLSALGYREVEAVTDNLLLKRGEKARGHEFHYSTLIWKTKNRTSAYETSGRSGKRREGYASENLLAGYTHLHFASNPAMAKRFISACKKYRSRRKNHEQ
ncbi:cobyrinate a,c-diamide synthase [Thermoactinomyces mirandus]|uniref:Cobyrinate a,c-diamide synthase n=1 Tax=Thermoactinomyces mirandus TaxID=2756294 RepID=A0A7W1XUZ0_9BACL|nr:cobyrinate a,c-diamide synthase [Thermoactinomyces mirandus]MBA4603688.1 cobyrinate a,c-diamide synthase [Thermoactinomyces mirandus]